MKPAAHAVQILMPSHGSTCIPDLVEAVGTGRFAARLVEYLNQLCGADHCAAFRFGPGRLDEVAAGSIDPRHEARAKVRLYLHEQLWRQDPAIHEAQRHLSEASRIIHLDLSDTGYSDLRATVYPQVRDRLLVCGRRHEAAFGLSVVRSDPHSGFSRSAIDELGTQSSLLLSLVAKHAAIVDSRPNPAQALSTLDEIEHCIEAASVMPRREREVGSRILYGLSTAGIALDVGIGEESVKTYRKRIYQRLSIGSERELLSWYLALWSRWREQSQHLPASAPAGSARALLH
jgi:DNA-binding CsgD family transcriptional regulator